MSLFATDRERTILRLFKNNTPQAMSILYDEYAGWLTAVCSRYVVNEEDRKDVLQESFIKIFTRINAFEYRGKGSLKAWMSRIAVNESLMMLRRSATNPADTTDNLPDMADESVSVMFRTRYRQSIGRRKRGNDKKTAARLPRGVQPVCRGGQKPQGNCRNARHKARHLGFAIPQSKEFARQND